MNRCYLIFLSSFAIFIFFLTPNVNTGDGGELVTAAWFLGTAHPSGYPLYSMIGKTFAFLPIGNIAFRIAVISALFSSLSLTLIYWLVLNLTTSSTASLFSVTALLVSYSYFTQSVVAKFYMLNLFLILLLFSMWADYALDTRRSARDDAGQRGTRLLYFTMFIAGLITANHHTGIIIFCPIAVIWIWTKNYPLKLTTFLSGSALFLSGFFINGYLVVRGSSGHFFNAENIDTLTDFYKVITRQAYGSSGTISAATHFFQGVPFYWYALRNFFSVLTSDFSYFSYPLFIAGSIYLIRKDIKLFIFFLLSLLLYGPVLAKLTMGSENRSEVDYYIVANQYFIPAISFFLVILGTGFYQFENFLRERRLNLLARVLPAIFAFFPLIFLVSRATDSNYRTDFVPYQVAKDTYSILPSDSVLMTFGDNRTYQGWYLKLAGRYREDICQLSSADQKNILWGFQGCNKKIYGAVFPGFYSKKFSMMAPTILKYRYYGVDPIEATGAYNPYLYSKNFSIDYLYIPCGADYDPALDQKRLLAADKVINYSACLSHFTDDLFSRQLCSLYAVHLASMAKLYSGISYHRTGEKVSVVLKDIRSGHDQQLYDIDVTEKNRHYFEISTHILRFNKWPIYYMR